MRFHRLPMPGTRVVTAAVGILLRWTGAARPQLLRSTGAARPQLLHGYSCCAVTATGPSLYLRVSDAVCLVFRCMNCCGRCRYISNNSDGNTSPLFCGGSMLRDVNLTYFLYWLLSQLVTFFHKLKVKNTHDYLQTLKY